MATQQPPPVDTNTTTTPVVPQSQIKRQPAPIEVPLNVTPIPLSEIDREPAPLPVTSTPVVIPLSSIDTAPAAVTEDPAVANDAPPVVSDVAELSETVLPPPLSPVNVIRSGPIYLPVAQDGTVVVPRTSLLNFLGNGVTVTSVNGLVANITIAGSTSYGDANVTNLLSSGIAGNIIPSANTTWNLGNATNQWNSLWVASNTIYIGGVPLSVAPGNTLTLAGEPLLSNDSNTTITTTGNITANYIIGDGAQISNVAWANITGAPSFITLGNLSVTTASPSGNGSLTYNNTSGVFTYTPADANLSQYGDTNVAAFLAAFGSNAVSTTGNITADYFFGNGSQLTGLNTNSISNGNSNVEIATANNNVTVTTAGTQIWTFDTNGDLTVPNYINFKGNTFIGDEPGSGSPAFRIVAPLTYGATIETDADISGNSWTWTFGADGVLGAPGNVTAPYFIGNGSQLTDLPDGTAIVNGTSQIDIPTANGNIYVGVNNVGSTEFTALGINTLTLAALANITAAGTITATGNITGGNISTAGTITAGNININGGITGAGSLTVQAAPNGNAYVNLDDISDSFVGAAANLYLLADSDNREWIFDTTGTLTTPGDITVGGDITGEAGANTLVVKAQPNSNTYIQLNSIVDSTVRTAANLDIVTDSSNTVQTWKFGTDGELTAPGNIRMGNAGASAMSQINTVANSSGDGNGYTTLELIPDENLTGTDQYLIIDPTAPGHIHIRAGGTQDNSGADLILGGEVSNVRVTAGANPPVYVSANNQSWIFGVDGVLQAPGDISTSGNISANTSGYAIGYRDIPQIAFTGNATLTASDAGKHYYSTLSTANVLTIADNSNVSWPVGTAISVVNRGSANITIARAPNVSLYLAGNSTVASRTLTTYGMATLLNVAANVWMINGTGIV